MLEPAVRPALKLYVSDVAPAIAVNVWPLSVLMYHWTVAAGLAFAAALSVTVLPVATTWLPGCMVTAGPKSTVNNAAAVVAWPTGFLKTARYSSLFSLA